MPKTDKYTHNKTKGIGSGKLNLSREIPRRLISFAVLFLIDVCLVFLSYYFAYYIRFFFVEKIIGIHHGAPFAVYIHFYFLIFIWPIVFAYEGLYSRRLSFTEEAMRLWRGTTIATGLVIFFAFVLKAYIISRTIVLLAWILSALFLPPIRASFKVLLARFGVWDRKLLVIGAGRVGKMLARGVQRSSSLGYRIVGFLDDDPKKLGKFIEGVPVLGRTDEIKEWAKKTRADGILISSPRISRNKLAVIIRDSENVSQEVFLIPDFLGLRTQGLVVETLDSHVLLRFQSNLLLPVNAIIKRAIDIFLSLLLFTLSLPLFVLASILIKLDSKGPIFFLQERVGRFGKTFKCIKFRTMYSNSDEILNTFLENNTNARDEWEKYKKLKSYSDPRVTKVGKALRRLSLDEIPQLFNVFLGEMSLVGPRPYLPSEINSRNQSLTLITSVRPGITGLWQVSGRSEISFQDRLALDEYYVRNWSLGMDAMILIKTLGAVLRGEGAY